jgi:hypothetical protein
MTSNFSAKIFLILKLFSHRGHSAAKPQPKTGHHSGRVLLRVTGDPRNPPSPPFDKGGLGGISEKRFPPKYSLQNFESLHVSSTESIPETSVASVASVAKACEIFLFMILFPLFSAKLFSIRNPNSAIRPALHGVQGSPEP